MIINLSRIDFGGIATGGKTKPEEVFDVQPTTSDQTITPTEGSVFSGGTVRAVTSKIDNNIASNNIKEGVTILGVAGTLKEEKPEESFNVQPTTAEQIITPTEGSVFSGGTVHAVTSAIDSNIQPENIKEGVSILGVAGTLSGGGSSSIIYDGSFDEDGLRAIGWTDEDIAYFEEVNPHFAWQNDQYKVSEENKALYLLDNLDHSSYKDNPNITFVPNKNMDYFKKHRFVYMRYIKGIPFFSTSNTGVNYQEMFGSCNHLTTIPPLDFSKATNLTDMFNGCTSLITIPQINTSNATNIFGMFRYSGLKTIPQLDFSNATDVEQLFKGCSALNTVPPINLSKVTNARKMRNMFDGCTKLTSVEGIDFSGLRKINDPSYGYIDSITNLFGTSTNMDSIKRFIVNGKLNISISDNYSLNALTHIEYDSVKSILEAANRTDDTSSSKKLLFNLYIKDQNGELAALVSSCTSKKWTISGLTLQ